MALKVSKVDKLLTKWKYLISCITACLPNLEVFEVRNFKLCFLCNIFLYKFLFSETFKCGEGTSDVTLTTSSEFSSIIYNLHIYVFSSFGFCETIYSFRDLQIFQPLKMKINWSSDKFQIFTGICLIY